MKFSHTFSLLLTLCCVLTIEANNTHFVYNGSNLILAPNDTFTQYYYVNGTDVFHIQDVTNGVQYFPKCCPPNYEYQTSDRKCVKSDDNTFIKLLAPDVTLIKSGLKDCEVIVDRILEFNELNKSLDLEGTFTYGNQSFTFGNYCFDGVLNKNSKAIARLCYENEYCWKTNGLRCLKKCCKDGDIYIGKSCGPQPEYGFSVEPYQGIISNETANFAIFTQRRSCKLHRPNISEENILINAKGNLNLFLKDAWKTFPVNEEMYCFEQSANEHLLLMCVDTSDRYNVKFTSSKIMMTLSCCCFIITMAVYLFVYKLEKIIHRIVFCYCLAQLIGFAILTYLQIQPFQTDYCKPLALIVLFGFLAGFSWLNIMCYDMWQTLGSMEAKRAVKNRRNLRKTFYYSLYAWSVPSIITTLCYFENEYNVLPVYLHAHIGEFFCILEQKIADGNYGHTLFFILPIALGTIANIYFFVLTIRYINQATDNIGQMNDSGKNKKRKNLFRLKKKSLTFMALKLFLVMGINWAFEVISSVINFSTYTVTKYIELVFDTFNCCQGIFVFLIFLFKWKLIKSILTKLKVIVVASVSRSTSTSSTT